MSETIFMGRDKHYSRGIQLYDSGLYTEAIAEFERVLGRDVQPNTPERRLASFFLGEAYTNLGLAHLRMNMYSRAEEEIRFALVLHPEYADLHFHLGQVMYRQNRYDEALLELQTALKINPKFARALIYLGLTRLRMGGDSGLADIANAVAMQSAYDDERYDKALVYYRDGKTGEALTLIEEVADLDLDQAGYLIERGLELMQRNEYAEALEVFDEAANVCPQYADVRRNLALCMVHEGRLDEAIGEFLEALAINPSFVGARIDLADTYAKKGERDRAIAEFERIIETDPDNLTAKHRLDALK